MHTDLKVDEFMRKRFWICLFAILLAACAKAAGPADVRAPATSMVIMRTELAPPVPQPGDLVIVGRLDYISTPPGCGYIHFGAVAEYSDLKIVNGKYPYDTIYVIHGCPELARSEYAKGSGTLTSFRVGDYHVLHLTLQNVYQIETIVTGEKLAKLRDVCSLDDPCSPETLVQRQSGRMYFSSQVDLYIP